jgi:vacuolar-type H+-ATPase subunit I/STV1
MKAEWGRDKSGGFVMREKLIRRLVFLVAVLFVVSLCFVEADAQRRRSRRSRRISNPVITAPATTTAPETSPQTTMPEAQIISTAEEQDREQTEGQAAPASNSRRAARSRTAQPESEQEALRRTVNSLSVQVTTLTEKIGKMEEQQRTLVYLERLSRAEQRAENLRTQLRDVQSKEADLQARADQLDYDLRPENIERSVSVFGSTRPEELRELRRRQLENERNRVRTQLDQLANSRIRLEAAIATVEDEVDRWRRIIDSDTARTGAPQPATTNSGTTQTPPAPTDSTEPPPQIEPKQETPPLN